MELKESIEILGNLKDYLQIKIDIGYHKLSYNDLGWDFKTVDSITAIDTVLQSLERKRELLKEFTETNRELTTALLHDNVPKDKIKKEIEELKVKLEDVSKHREKAKEQEEQAVLWCLEIRLDERIKAYEELLKGE